jgi:hypothetical protein
MIPWLAILELVLTVGLLGLLLWIAVTPFIKKELSDQDKAVILENRLTDFLRDPCISLGRAVLRELPRKVYRFSWYDATAGRVPCTGVSRFWSASGAIWGVEEVKAYLKELKA